MHRPGCYSRPQARLPAAPSLPRSPAYFRVYYSLTSYPPLRWLRSLAERVLSPIPLFLLPRAPAAFFVWALPTHPSSHAVLPFRPFLIGSLEPIRVGVVTETVLVHKRTNPIRALFIPVKCAHPLGVVRRFTRYPPLFTHILPS